MKDAGRLILCAAGLTLSAGCASTQMKGTPFYTGEYAHRIGPASDRVNLWPLLYYRKPAMSVLWPLIEVTDEHVAVRPLFSVYDTDKARQVVNVLWPIASFDMQRNRHRVFPVFWGDNHAAVFPLYWHKTRPASGSLTDGLFPLWWYSRDGRGFDLDVLMPVFHLRRRDDSRGWRVWPAAGSYTAGKDSYSFYAWPLGHVWKKKAASGSMLFPLYWHNRVGGSISFYSLPYSRHRGARTGYDSDWDLVFPFFCRSEGGGRSGWGTPLYGQGGSGDGSERWRYAVPFFYHGRDRSGDLLVTPLGGRRKTGPDSSWVAIPALSWGERSGNAGSVNVLGPLARWKWAGRRRSSYVFPLYCKSTDGRAGSFFSAPWSSGREADGASWQLAFPFMFRRSEPGGKRVLLTPIFSSGKGAGDLRWHALVPLYYSMTSDSGRTFATPLGGFASDRSGRRWILYPLLSGGRRTPDGGELWLAAPLFHASWNAAGKSHHLFPFYYWNGPDRAFFSPLAAAWNGPDGSRKTVVPPLLTYYSGSEKRSDLWIAAGLARLSWGAEPGPRHVFPLYYGNPRSGTFLTPLYSGWKDGPSHVRIIPPLLSGWSRGQASRHTVAALGLFQRHRDPRESWSYLFPLYFEKRGVFFITPLFGWNSERENGFVYPFTPLAGFFRGRYAGGWVFPLYGHKRDTESGEVNGRFLWGSYHRDGSGLSSRSGIFPLYSYENLGRFNPDPRAPAGAGLYGKRFICMPGFWYSNRMFVGPAGGSRGRTYTKRNGCFPLWTYSRTLVPEEGRLDVRSSFLLLLHDYRHTLKPDPASPGGESRYVRSRILWRMWHYERSGSDVSVDVFPAITYDRRGTSFKKTSFLWRFFRYERDGNARKLDLLFVPVVRTSEKGKTAN